MASLGVAVVLVVFVVVLVVLVVVLVVVLAVLLLPSQMTPVSKIIPPVQAVALGTTVMILLVVPGVAIHSLPLNCR